MAVSRRTGRSRLTLVLLILTSITVLTLDFRDSTLVQDARRMAATVLGPVRDAADGAFEPVSDAWNGITDYGDLENENERLREQLEALQGEQLLDEGAAEQLAEFLRQENIPWVKDIPTTKAEVVAGPGSNFTYSLDIDKGSDDGLKVGMPVVTGVGLVGRLVQVTDQRSTVQLLTDPDFSVGVKFAARNALGTARGRGRDASLVVDTNIDPDRKIRNGTLVTTAGTDDATYPKSIPIGRVESTRDTSGGLALELLVDPFVDVSNVTLVTVLLWEPPT